MKAHFVTGVVVSVLALSSAAVGQVYLPPLLAERNVEIVVDSSLYASGEITDSLTQYMLDVQAQGYTPTLTTTAAFADAASLRAHLANRYATDGLAGAVFVGDVPLAQYEIAAHVRWGYDKFPIELYFQDLDGTWADGDGDGVYDTHSGDRQPEIWVGRMATSKLTGLHSGRTEASLLNDYFAKNHAYRRGQLSAAPNGLTYVDDDWAARAPGWGAALEQAVSGGVDVVNDKATTTASDYEARLAEDYEHIYLGVHSGTTVHQFQIDNQWSGGRVDSDDLEALDPQALFYLLYTCDSAAFNSGSYMAGEYVFGAGNGLLSVGSSKTGGMLSAGGYFYALSEGNSFGASFQKWWNYGVNSPDWHYGMTLAGDPLLLPQMYQDFLVWGDFDQDGDADADDIDLLRQQIGGGDLRYDVDGDGDCDSDDLTLLVENLVEWSEPISGDMGVGTAIGDFNLDGIVNVADLTILGGNFGAGTTWAEGNANADSVIDTTDLAMLATNFGFVASGAVPEPASLSLLALGAAGLAAARKRK